MPNGAKSVETERARDLAREAIALAVRLQGRVKVRDKGGGHGPVTEADLAVEDLLLAGLRAAFPDDPVLSEETRTAIDLPVRRLWCVDPIDGTREYVEGRDEYAVHVGLLEEGVPVAGAVGLPGRLIWGGRGGVWIEEEGNTRAATLAPLSDLAQATVVHTRRHMTPALRRMLDALGAARCVPMGGIGYKVSRILLGEAHAMLHDRGTTWWDSVAPAALLLGAGGTVADARGRPLDYRTDTRHHAGLLFAAPGLLAPLRARLAQVQTE
ncbi:MAG TPA: 3'(2'),5'-bisphosphate nucleotidase CysQ [Planctomycetota bacterium]|nr:3'(2'),5'-bisphosphate nucleotidase CysQ [Planctomycetota bacterium]